MLRRPLRWAYLRLGPRYPRVLVALQFQMAHLVVAGGLGLLWLYVPDLDSGSFWRMFAVAQGLVVLDNLYGIRLAWRCVRPADAWLRGDRTPETAVAAWRALAGLPRDWAWASRGLPVVMSLLPVSAYVTWELGDGWFPELPILVAGSAVVLSYGVFVRFFSLELIVRPVLERLSWDVPDGADLGRATVTLKWRLLLALPAMNVITGVTVVGLTNPDDGLSSLGLGVLVALGVAATVSLELAVLVLRTILEPVQDLRRGTEAVAGGDLRVRVPVLGTDEVGDLTRSFNRMVTGLEERERLREAFGAYVDPDLAERVLREGTELAGEEVEVTVLLLDVRGFTAWSEQRAARDVVALLNELWGAVVPVVARHGGHANKFVGDGLLAVFGAPERLDDHADRAVAAALEVVRVVAELDGPAIGIGVNTGPVVAGTVGGGGRVEFTVIGDAVNTAARVESATRETGDAVLITAATRDALRRDHGGFAGRGPVVLRGKAEPVELCAPLAAAAYGQASVS